MQESKKRMWCFTLNNYTDNDLTTISQWITTDRCKYGIVGKEIGESGTPHLQGYIHLIKPVRFTSLKKFLPNAHWEPAKGTPAQNKQYCSKDGNIFIEIGEITSSSHKGGTSGLVMKRAIEIINEMVEDRYTEPPEDQRVLFLYRKRIKEEVEHREAKIEMKKLKEKYENVTWKEWQQDLLDELDGVPHPRKIIVVVDKEGNKGKSYLSSYLLTQGALLSDTTKKADIAYAMLKQRIVIFDLARHQQDHINWGTIEALKNGNMFSPKYMSKCKIFRVPHVVVMMNDYPDTSRLSEDRWDIRDISDKQKEDEDNLQILEALLK